MILSAYEFEQLQEKGFTTTDAGKNLWIFKVKNHEGNSVPLILDVSAEKNQLLRLYKKAEITITPEMCIEEEVA